MSEYTTRQILDMIEANEGPRGLNLSGKDLSGIDLSREAIAEELEKARERGLDEIPVWDRREFREQTGGINLQGANLQEANLAGANLRGAYVAGANLQRAFVRGANLQGAILASARVQGAFLALTNFQEALLVFAKLQGAYLGSANLKGANLSDANLKEAHLWDANLKGADLRHANLKGAYLVGARLQEAYLRRTRLPGAILIYCHLEKVNLFGAESLKGAWFYHAFLDDTRLRRDQLGDAIGEELHGRYGLAREAYMALKNNFAEIGRYGDESWAYVKERQMGKMCHAPWRARRFYVMGAPQRKPPSLWTNDLAQLDERWGDTEESKLPAWHPRVLWSCATHTRKWALDWIEELLCKYGESLGRVLGWMIASLLGFAAYYWRIGGVWLVEPNGEARVATSFWHYLIYSAGAFTTTQFARLQAADDRVRMVTAIQAIIGIVLAGLLGFVAGNRIRRS